MMNAGLGARQVTRDIIGAQDSSFGKSTMFKIQAQESLKIIKDDQDLLRLKIGIGIEKGDLASVAEALFDHRRKLGCGLNHSRASSTVRTAWTTTAGHSNGPTHSPRMPRYRR
jgi:hypothetical protein